MEHYHAYGPERGATLETIDKPVTDRAYLERALAAMTEDGEIVLLGRNDDDRAPAVQRALYQEMGKAPQLHRAHARADISPGLEYLIILFHNMSI